MKKVLVTGGSGKAGRAIVHDLLERGYEVRSTDIVRPTKSVSPFIFSQLTDLGQTIDVMKGMDAVVHMAAIPAPGIEPEGETFRINTMSTWNVFSAARTLGISRVVWASSETTLGLPFDRVKPKYVPIDEEHPLYPESSYALSKVCCEEMARQFCRWTEATPNAMTIIGLRFSNIMEPDDYAKRFPSFWDDARKRKWNVWGYVDARDVAQSCRLSLEAKISGAHAFIIAASDTVMDRPNRVLMKEVFPDVPIKEGTGDFVTLLSIEKARKMLGYDPEYSWRAVLRGPNV